MKARALNRFDNIGIDWLSDVSIDDIVGLPLDVVKRLDNDIEFAIAELKQRQAMLYIAIEQEFSDDLLSARKSKGSDFGAVNVKVGDYTIVQTVPKNVSWDQEKLDTIADKLEVEWKEDPTEYIDVKNSVQERKYNAWPTAIKKLFQPARTVKPGRTKLEIKGKSEDA